MELHKHVCWWVAPQLQKSGGIFLVKPLRKVSWQFDGLTYRATNAEVLVRVCVDGLNCGHPDCGQEFLARGRDLVAVQYGIGNN